MNSFKCVQRIAAQAARPLPGAPHLPQLADVGSTALNQIVIGTSSFSSSHFGTRPNLPRRFLLTHSFPHSENECGAFCSTAPTPGAVSVPPIFLIPPFANAKPPAACR